MGDNPRWVNIKCFYSMWQGLFTCKYWLEEVKTWSKLDVVNHGTMEMCMQTCLQLCSCLQACMHTATRLWNVEVISELGISILKTWNWPPVHYTVILYPALTNLACNITTNLLFAIAWPRNSQYLYLSWFVNSAHKQIRSLNNIPLNNYQNGPMSVHASSCLIDKSNPRSVYENIESKLSTLSSSKCLDVTY